MSYYLDFKKSSSMDYFPFLYECILDEKHILQLYYPPTEPMNELK